MTKNTQSKVKSLTIAQTKLIFEVLKESSLTGKEIYHVMQDLKSKGLIKSEDYF